MSTAWNGIMNASSTTPNARPEYRNRNSAKPYPASNATSEVRIAVVSTATIRLLTTLRRMSSWPDSSVW